MPLPPRTPTKTSRAKPRDPALLFPQASQHFSRGGELVLKVLEAVALFLDHLGGARSTKLLFVSFFSLAAMKPVSFSTSCFLRAISAGTSINSARSTYTSMPESVTLALKAGAVTSGPKATTRALAIDSK